MERKLLYVDGLNYSSRFGFTVKCWNLKYPTEKIEEFVEAAKVAGFTLKVFIDAGIESSEAIAKWKERRELEVLGEYKHVPQGLSTFLGDIFRLNGVEVGYSPVDADNDDCLAAHAQADGADILSNDKDFFRYTDRRYKLFGDFQIVDGRLILNEKKEPRPNPRFPAPEPRAIIKPPVMLKHNPAFNTVETMNFYRRGAPSSLVKLLGNPNRLFVDLRRALYYKMGKRELILETWPEWNPKTEQVVWHSEKVEPQPLQESFDSFVKALINSTAYELPSFPGVQDCEKKNHRFAVMSLAYEIYVAMEDNKKSLYDLMLPYDSENSDPETRESIPNVCSNWFNTGECKFGKSCLAGESGHQDCPDFKSKDGCRRGKFCRWRHP